MFDKEYKEQDNNDNKSDGDVDIAVLLATEKFEEVWYECQSWPLWYYIFDLYFFFTIMHWYPKLFFLEYYW